MKKLLPIPFIVLFLASMAFPMQAIAATPTLTIERNDRDSVSIDVYGDKSASVRLYYYDEDGDLESAGTIGSTNRSGYFSTTLDDDDYDIPSRARVYVKVNSKTSNVARWPEYTSYDDDIDVSDSSITLTVGDTAYVDVYSDRTPYISRNIRSSVARASINSRDEVVITAKNEGTTTITVCVSSRACTDISVDVTDEYYDDDDYDNFWISQNSITISRGSYGTLSLYGNNRYYVTSIGNANIATAQIRGNTLYVYGGNYNGTTNVTVCSGERSYSCQDVWVSVVGRSRYW